MATYRRPRARSVFIGARFNGFWLQGSASLRSKSAREAPPGVRHERLKLELAADGVEVGILSLGTWNDLMRLGQAAALIRKVEADQPWPEVAAWARRTANPPEPAPPPPPPVRRSPRQHGWSGGRRRARCPANRDPVLAGGGADGRWILGMIGNVVSHGRSGRDARNLCAHLLKTEMNERVAVRIDNMLSSDLRTSLRDMQLMRDGTKADAAFVFTSRSAPAGR